MILYLFCFYLFNLATELKHFNSSFRLSHIFTPLTDIQWLFAAFLLGLFLKMEFHCKFHWYAQGLNSSWILKKLTVCFAHDNSCFWGPQDLVILKCVLADPIPTDENATWEVIFERKTQREQPPWKSCWCIFTSSSCYHLYSFARLLQETQRLVICSVVPAHMVFPYVCAEVSSLSKQKQSR